MIQIYLCDDEEAILHQIKTALEWKIFVENYDMEVACAAATARELLDAAQDGSRSWAGGLSGSTGPIWRRRTKSRQWTGRKTR